MVFAIAAATAAVVERVSSPGVPGELLAGLVLLALPAAAAAWADRLPALNAVLAGLAAGALGGLTHAVDQATALPFGGMRFDSASGPQWLGVLPWAMPAAWFVATLNARGGARWLLCSAAPGARQGWAVMGLAALLGAGLLAGLLAAGARAQLWSAPAWGGAAATLLAGQVLLQVALTPLLLDKFPRPRPASALPLLALAPAVLLVVALGGG